MANISYDSGNLLLSDFLRVTGVTLMPNPGGRNLVEVRALAEESENRLWKSLRYQTHQDSAPKAGDIIEILVVRPTPPTVDEQPTVVEQSVTPHPPTDEE